MADVFRVVALVRGRHDLEPDTGEQVAEGFRLLACEARDPCFTHADGVSGSLLTDARKSLQNLRLRLAGYGRIDGAEFGHCERLRCLLWSCETRGNGFPQTKGCAEHAIGLRLGELVRPLRYSAARHIERARQVRMGAAEEVSCFLFRHAHMLTLVNPVMSTPVSGVLYTLLNMTTFQERIEEAASDKGLTRSALAKLLDMTRSNMTHWFGGRAVNPKADAVARAASILGVNPLWLSSGKGPKHPTDEKGKPVKPIKVKPDTDAGAILRMYDSMPEHIRPIARRQWRDLLEAYGPKGDDNPFGKGQKRAAKKNRKPGTQ